MSELSMEFQSMSPRFQSLSSSFPNMMRNSSDSFSEVTTSSLSPSSKTVAD